jgi:hypothetical protein
MHSKSIAVFDARAALEARVDCAHRETEDKFQKYIDVLKKTLDNLPRKTMILISEELTANSVWRI